MATTLSWVRPTAYIGEWIIGESKFKKTFTVSPIILHAPCDRVLFISNKTRPCPNCGAVVPDKIVTAARLLK